MVELSTRPYIQIMRPFLKWMLPFFVVISGAVASYGGFPAGMALLKLVGALVLYCVVVQGICIRVTNDIFDAEVDRLSPKDEYAKFRPIAFGIITKGDAAVYAAIGHIIALVLSYSLGMTVFIITVLTLISQFLYSAPPLRLKRFFPVNNIIIGIFYGGAFFLAGWALYNTINSVALNAALFLIIFVSIFNITKDYSDVEGDRTKGIRTLPVIFGVEKAGRINTVLIVFFYMVLLLFIVTGLLPVYSALIFISVPFFLPGVYRLYRLDEKVSPKERKRVMNITMPVGFLVFVLLGVSLILG